MSSFIFLSPDQVYIFCLSLKSLKFWPCMQNFISLHQRGSILFGILKYTNWFDIFEIYIYYG